MASRTKSSHEDPPLFFTAWGKVAVFGTYNGAHFGRRAVNLNGGVDDGHFGCMEVVVVVVVAAELVVVVDDRELWR
jgi:hypothetical protein